MNEVFTKHVLEQIGTSDIFKTRFLDEEFCNIILNLFRAETDWSTKKFAYSTQDIQLEERYPDLFNIIKERFERSILTTMNDIWYIDQDVEVKDIFCVKYSEDTQNRLKTHIDDSYISGSIKLNSDYQGGVLKFPRQDVDNSELAPGDLLLWPSLLTHPHNSNKITKGEKYALTIWTKTGEEKI